MLNLNTETFYICEKNPFWEDITKTINALILADPHVQEVPEDLYGTFEFFDDISGKVLNKELAIAARRLEMQFFRKNW